MRQVTPIPPGFNFAPTLARRVLQLRELRNMTVKDLSRWSRFHLKRIEDIEAGLETWLSSTDRQLLAKALSVEPAILEEAETRTHIENSHEIEIACRKLSQLILEGYRDLSCPICKNQLKCSIQEGYDLEGMPLSLPKAFCIKCPFVLH